MRISFPICQFNFPICGWKQIYSENSSPPTLLLLSLIFMGRFSGFVNNQFCEWERKMRFWGDCIKGTFSQDSSTINFTSERDLEETVQRNIRGKVHWPDAAKIYFLWRQNDTMQRLKQNRKDQQKVWSWMKNHMIWV